MGKLAKRSGTKTLRQAIHDILKHADLDSISLKVVRREAEQVLGLAVKALDAKKDAIGLLVDAELAMLGQDKADSTCAALSAAATARLTPDILTSVLVNIVSGEPAEVEGPLALLCRCAQVSKAWQSSASEDRMWSKCFRRRWGAPQAADAGPEAETWKQMYRRQVETSCTDCATVTKQTVMYLYGDAHSESTQTPLCALCRIECMQRLRSPKKPVCWAALQKSLGGIVVCT